MIFKNYRKDITNLLIYFGSLSVENKLKLSIKILESNCIKFKIDKEKIIEILKKLVCIFDKDYNKDVKCLCTDTTEIFVLAKVMEMYEEEQKKFIYEILFDIYCNIFGKR